MNANKIYKKATKKWGIALQSIKTAEECGELVQAIAKILLDKGSVQHLAEELADVQIMVEQMICAYNLKVQVKKFRTNKLKRIEKRLSDD